VSERSVRKIERGEVWPDLDTVARLAYALNVTASALLCEPDKRRH
jgi:transcriptional regulator with XRE-family HTH domain